MNFSLLVLAALVKVGYWGMSIDNAGTFTTQASCESAGAASSLPVSIPGQIVVNSEAHECIGFTPATDGDPSYTLLVQAHAESNSRTNPALDRAFVYGFANMSDCQAAEIQAQNLAVGKISVQTACYAVN